MRAGSPAAGGRTHSVTLDAERCKGCTNCIKRCPTEAIRVRKGKARITEPRCVDCGECIRTCPYHAKKAVFDGLSLLREFDYRIALPAPALYGQFPEERSVDEILGALLAIGFDEVFEVALAADLAAKAARDLVAGRGASAPMISSSCPAVLRLARISFPSLLDKFAPILPPMEIAARLAAEGAAARFPGAIVPGRLAVPGAKGPREGGPRVGGPRVGGPRVGIFFVTPCPAKVSAVRNPDGYATSAVSGVFSFKEIYLPMTEALRRGVEPRKARASGAGLAWARTEGESEAVGSPRSLSVDGIQQVIGVLEAVESGQIRGVDFIEAMACPGGCVGGALAVENPYIAKTRISNRAARAKAGAAKSTDASGVPDAAGAILGFPSGGVSWTEPVKPRQVLQLHEDLLKALIMLEELEQTKAALPGLDCGSCGAPSCMALAEDIVKGEASATDCVFKLREKIRLLAGEMLALENIQPPGLDKE